MMKKLKIATILLIFLTKTGLSQTTIADSTLVSGNWTVANSPYIIEGRAIVPNGQTLTIEPGVEIRLKSSASPTPSWFDFGSGNVGVIRVEGEINANGTASNPILFTRNNTGFWGSVLIDENPGSNSSFTYCIIEYAKETRNVTGITSPISFSGGLSIYKTNITVNDSEFRKNNINGIYIREVNTSFDFSKNIFYDNGSNGAVIEGSTVNGINNTFYNNSISASGSVSAVRLSNSNVYLVGNLIYNNDDFGIFTTNGGNNYLVNNTIYGNKQGIRVETGANTFIINSIIQNNNLNFATGNTGGATIEMQYSLTDDPSFPINVSDITGNIIGSDALFTNAGSNDFSLQIASPCIDSGSPDTTGLNIPAIDIHGNTRIDNGNIDIGAIEFQQPIVNYTVTTTSNPTIGGTTSGDGTYTSGSGVTVTATPNSDHIFINWMENGNVLSTNNVYSFTITDDRNLVANFQSTVGVDESYINQKELLVYPNPTIGLIHIVSDSYYSAELYSLNGKLIARYTSATIDLSFLTQGVYSLRIETTNGDVVNKKIIKR